MGIDMTLEIYEDGDQWVVCWSYKDVFVKFYRYEDACAFAREMISNWTGVTV